MTGLGGALCLGLVWVVALPEESQRLYDHGQFAEALQRAEKTIDQGGLSESQRVDLHRLAGLAAFHEQKEEAAERHFSALLRLQPDYAMDPFSVPPKARAYFEQLREKLSPELTVLRTERAMQKYRDDLQAQERARITQLSAQSASTTSPRWLDLAPFGLGYFRQGRHTKGIFSASGQGVLALASVVSLVSFYGVMSRRPAEVPGSNGMVRVTEWGIRPHHQNVANAWRTVNLISTIGFYGLWALSAADAWFAAPSTVGGPGVQVGGRF